MGYSCAKAAGDVLDSLSRYNANLGKKYPSNGWYYRGKDYFYEVGKENYDGAITGGVYDRKGYKAGTFRIEPNGSVSRGAGGLKTILNLLKEPFIEISDWRNWKL